MKLKFLTIVMGVTFLMLILQGASAGRAAVGGQDRTGAPGSLSGTCIACHANAATFGTVQIAMVAKDMSGTVVTSYIPGDTLTLEFTVTKTAGTPSGYAMQAVALNSANTNIGSFLAVSTPNTRLSTIANGRKFIEQSGKNTLGIFRGTWKAPVAGTGNVKVYAVGMAVNGNGSDNGDRTSASTLFTLPEAVTSSITDVPQQKLSYNIFPIPNNGSFNLQNLGEAGVLDVQIINMQGALVYNKSVFVNSNSSELLQAENLAPGIYSVQILKGNDVQVLNMVVTH